MAKKGKKNSFECEGKGMAGRNGEEERERKCFLMNKEEKVYVVYKNGKKEILWKLRIWERYLMDFRHGLTKIKITLIVGDITER